MYILKPFIPNLSNFTVRYTVNCLTGKGHSGSVFHLTIFPTDPPGPASVNLNAAVWLENRTYSVSCNSAPGNPQNQYTLTLNGQLVHTGSEYNITAHKDQDQAVLACNVSNGFTVDRNLAVYDTKQLVVHCKCQWKLITFTVDIIL